MKLRDLIQRLLGRRATPPQAIGSQPRGKRSVTRQVVDVSTLEEPRPGARLQDYCRAILGVRPVLDDERDTKLAQARVDAHRHEAEIARRRAALERLLAERAKFSRAWVRLSLLGLVLAVEFAAAEWLWRELGLDSPWSVLLALTLVIFSIYIVYITVRQGAKSIWFYVAAGVFVCLATATAVVRSGEVEDDYDDPAYNTALVFVLACTVVGPPLIAEKLLRAHLEVAPIDRQITDEARHLAALEAQQAAARHYLDVRYQEVAEYEAWEELLQCAALAQFPDFFGPDPGAGDPGEEVPNGEHEPTERPADPGPGAASADPSAGRGGAPGGAEDAAGDGEAAVALPRLAPDRD